MNVILLLAFILIVNVWMNGFLAIDNDLALKV